MMDHDDLDNALHARFVPPSPRGLSAWIIAEAQDMPQEQGGLGWCLSRTRWICDVWQDARGALCLPQPAFVLTIFLFLGVSMGIYGEFFDVVPGLTTDDLSGFMLIEDRFLAAEFWEAGAL